ncbi:MAG TPA: hypothetical protein VHW26_00705 [Solirubrobacteraceae bacterium]|nr:hypothetical protein [Solirubrobacteraceae bacterium]
MTDPAPDPPPIAEPATGWAWIGSHRRLTAGIGVVLAAVIVAVAVVVLDGGSTPSTAGSPPLPAAYRPGLGIGPVSLGEARRAVVAGLGGPGREPLPGTLVFTRQPGQLAVGFTNGRASSILATGSGNPFGQRLAAEETTLAGWNVAVCEKPAHVLLVAPGGHTYFVFRTAVAGLGAVGVSTSPVTACGQLG